MFIIYEELKGVDRIINGKVIIDFKYDEETKCSWDLQQTGKDKLDDEDLINLFQHIIGELMAS
jgi:hypothetical protein